MPLSATATDLADAYALCEDIARRDKPHLYTAAQQFEHRETREAFAAAYASMRFIDDFVDDIPGRANLGDDARREAEGMVQRWLTQVRAAHAGQAGQEPVRLALSHTFSRFDLPLDPWEDLAHAMETDLHVSQFENWEHLRRYMRGASVAPAVIFMHLVLVHPNNDGRTFSCPWDYAQVAAATEDLAIFCYWAHILRDVAKDLDAGGTGLVYFPRQDLEAFQLSVNNLHQMRSDKKASAAYVSLAKFEAERAHEHLVRGRKYLPDVLATALPSHGRALTSLVQTYEGVLRELAQNGYDVFANSPQTTD
jgi:phytoene synthase